MSELRAVQQTDSCPISEELLTILSQGSSGKEQKLKEKKKAGLNSRKTQHLDFQWKGGSGAGSVITWKIFIVQPFQNTHTTSCDAVMTASLQRSLMSMKKKGAAGG